MEFFVIIIIGAIVIYIVMRNNSKSSDKLSSKYSIRVTTESAESVWDDDSKYEDKYFFKENPVSHKLMNVEWPLFYALTSIQEFKTQIPEQFTSLAEKLASITNDNVKSAIYQLIPQSHFKERKGLPQYLKVVPIQNLLSMDIFQHPTKEDIPILLDSLKMVELRSICKEREIKPGKTKAETVAILAENDLEELFDFSQYFRLNPGVSQINDLFTQFALNILEKTLNNTDHTILEISKPLQEDELGNKFEKDGFILQTYGYKAVVYGQGTTFHHIIHNATLDSWGNRILLLQNGKIAISRIEHIDDAEVMSVDIYENDLNHLNKELIRLPNSRGISQIEEKPFLYVELQDGSFWLHNYITNSTSIIPNPEKLDIYTIVQSQDEVS